VKHYAWETNAPNLGVLCALSARKVFPNPLPFYPSHLASLFLEPENVVSNNRALETLQ